ncbi:MAG: hypothetical protein WA705_21725 [Candidatus Ozemobacteraceae bacterium]
MRIFPFILLVLLSSMAFSGCGGSSETISTGFPTAGPGINLTASSRTVPFGGNSIITAVVNDSTGVPVSASVLTGQMVFSSILGGSFDSAPVYSDGLVTVKYTAPAAEGVATQATVALDLVTLPSDTPIYDEITVSFRGALAKLPIMLHRVY